MGLSSVETLTNVRMPSLQFYCYGSSGWHRSFTVERPRLQRRGGGGARWSSHTYQRVKVAGHGCFSTFTEGFNFAQSSRQEVRRPVVVRSLEKASDYSDTTNFFFDELIEAQTTVEKLVKPENPWQEEGTSQRKEDKNSENWDVWQDSEMSSSGKLPLESNGPPMVILRPYLVADNSQEKQKLRQLPLPMPHKVRPAGLPRPSLRRRLGVAYSRKAGPVGQERFISRDLAVDV